MKKRFSRDRLRPAAMAGAEAGDPPFESDRLSGDPDPMSAGPFGAEGSLSSSEAGASLFDFEGPEEPAEPDWEEGLIRLVVAAPEAGRRLDAALAARCPDFSRTQLARLAKEGLIRLDDRPAKAGAVLAAGQVITFPPPEPPLTDLRPEPEVVLDVLYEDEHLLVIDKPWGLAVHPAPGYRGPTLAGGLLARDQRLAGVGEAFRPGLVHRLDKDTSGVLVTARTETALRRLAEAFSLRETKKRYLAFVRGRPAKTRGLIDSPIGRHPTQRHKMAAGVAGGRSARTRYRVLRHFPSAAVSLVLLTLITGRTHQARVHLQSLGTPVLADPVYSRGVGDLTARFPQLIPYLQRQMLHARRLTIAHPATGRPETFRAPWPPDFLGLLRELLRLEK